MSFFSEQANFVRFREAHKTRSKRLIVFSGAGASLEAGLPTWGEFIDGLKAWAIQNTETTVARAILEAKMATLASLDTDWDRVEELSNILKMQFENAVRDVLNPSKPSELTTFGREVWKLNPNALLTVNLDGFALKSYAALKSGTAPKYFTGSQVTLSREIFSDNRPLIVDLHGSIDLPQSWVVTKTQYQALVSNTSYTEFLKSVFNHNIILFYGVGIYDGSISNQIMYLNDLGFVTGEYFVLRKKNKKPRVGQGTFDTPVRTIWLPDDLSWEAGFESFVREVNLPLEDAAASPVTTAASKVGAEMLPTVPQLMTMEPDEARKILSSQTSRYFISGEFQYKAYENFCREYDSAIHHASRVRLDAGNDRWLGYHLTEPLGQGNFGRVFRAEKRNEDFAIKIAHDEVRDNETMLDSFRRGVSSMKILRESGIDGVVGIRDASELPPSIVMEYVDGIDLQNFVETRAHKNDYDLVLKILHRVHEILLNCHRHEQVILHRDLRPSNIMLRGTSWKDINEQSVCVLDFDLSWFKGAKGLEFFMNPSSALGYLAPEQLNQGSKYSPRSALVDVYGIGMLLYYSLAGEHPVANASVKYDWEDKINHAAQTLTTPKWRSVRQLAARTMRNCTFEDQDRRWDMQQLGHALSTLIAIRGGEFPKDPMVVLEEVLTRSVVSSEEPNVGFDHIEVVTGGGLTVRGTVEQLLGTYRFEVSLSDDGSINRASRAKFFDRSLNRAKDVASAVGTVDQKRSTVVLGGSKLVFSTDIPSDLSEATRLWKAIDQVIGAFRLAD